MKRKRWNSMLRETYKTNNIEEGEVINSEESRWKKEAQRVMVCMSRKTNKLIKKK